LLTEIRSPTLNFVAECGLVPATVQIDAETLARYNKELEEVIRHNAFCRITVCNSFYFFPGNESADSGGRRR
jgi:hypothetical protein